jgi:hypothetical protein
MTFKERNIEFSRLKSRITKNATLKECLLRGSFNDCSDDIINAHSLQRMGALARIEYKVGSNVGVYTLTETQLNTVTGEIELKLIGKKDASTFFGFCGYHDSELFKPIEQNPDLIDLGSPEHCFLFSFRAFAISYHRKKEVINLFSKRDEPIRTWIRNYYGFSDIKSYLELSKIGLQDLNRYKGILFKALKNRQYGSLDYLIRELDYTVPVAMSMMTTPPFLFSGLPINTNPDPDYQYSDILTTVIPLGSRSLIILAAFPNDPYGKEFLTELEDMSDIEFQKALTWHILTTSENCFFSPKWFDKLDTRQKQSIIKLSGYSADVKTPYLEYNRDQWDINFFDKNHSI